MCDSIISEDLFSIRYVPDQYKTQKMCDKAVDDSLAALKFIPDWLVTSKMIKEHSTALYANENILYFKDYLCCKTITSQNVSSEAQIKNFFIL